MAEASRPCKGCGAEIRRTAPVAPIRHYCSPECRPRCSVDGCEKPVHTKGMCSAHATRAARKGDPLTPRERYPNNGPCEVDGCERPMRKRRMCTDHYAIWRRRGEVGEPFYKWADLPTCLICDKPNGGYRSRKFCSAACQQRYSRHDGRPNNPRCARCAVEIDLQQVHKKYRNRTDTKLCRRCRAMRSGWLSPSELAQRDGPSCGICGCDVDLGAKAPDPMRASTDHIIPRARGGSDEPTNQQLAHLWCNQVKSDRIAEPVPTASTPRSGEGSVIRDHG